MLKSVNTLLFSVYALAGWQAVSAEQIPMTPEHWEMSSQAFSFEKYLERDALRLESGGSETLGLVKDLVAQDGTLEFDVAFPEMRAFIGTIWRLQSNFADSELFYLRSHQSGNPDSMQYMPIYNGLDAWQLYSEVGHYAQAMPFDFNQWTHVKLQVAGNLGEIYVKDMDKPKLVMPLHHKPQAGIWGLMVGSVENPKAAAYFSNVSFTAGTPQLHTAALPVVTPVKGTVIEWQVSDTFAEKDLVGTQLPAALQKALKWQKVGVEGDGLLNLAKVQGLAEDKDTVFVKVTLHADKAVVKRLDVGFSDRVKLYCNGQLLFSADDAYKSRDYRFLGSIGYFDSLYLPLQQGDNEVWLAISESFGGWGVKAKLEDMQDVRFK